MSSTEERLVSGCDYYATFASSSRKKLSRRCPEPVRDPRCCGPAGLSGPARLGPPSGPPPPGSALRVDGRASPLGHAPRAVCTQNVRRICRARPYLCPFSVGCVHECSTNNRNAQALPTFWKMFRLSASHPCAQSSGECRSLPPSPRPGRASRPVVCLSVPGREPFAYKALLCGSGSW